MTYASIPVKKLGISFFALFAALSMLAAVTAMAEASSNTKGVVFQDVADGSGDLRDTIGTGEFGFVNSNQDANLNLRVVSALQDAAPNTTYRWTVYCGSTHLTAFFTLATGELTTNPRGNANTGAIHIPAADLLNCVGSDGVGHIDWDNTGTTGTYVGSPIPYEIPAP